MRLSRCVCRFLVITIIAGAVPYHCVTAADIEIEKGVALRENLLVFRWPSDIAGMYGTDRDFGISETRARLWSDLRWRDVTFSGALESRMNFTSSDLSAFGGDMSEGSRLGRSRPIERGDWSKGNPDAPEQDRPSRHRLAHRVVRSRCGTPAGQPRYEPFRRRSRCCRAVRSGRSRRDLQARRRRRPHQAGNRLHRRSRDHRGRFAGMGGRRASWTNA